MRRKFAMGDAHHFDAIESRSRICRVCGMREDARCHSRAAIERDYRKRIEHEHEEAS